MKKFYIISINLIVIILSYFVLKYIFIFLSLSKVFPLNTAFEFTNWLMKNVQYEELYRNTQYRPIENIESKERPIIILGCSFAQGVSSKPLDDNETISSLLAKEFKIKRPIHNRAIGSQSLQAMIWQFASGEIQKIVKKEPELIVYVLINDSIRRLYMECNHWNSSLFYKENKKNGIEEIKNPIYYSFLAKTIRTYVFEKYIFHKNITDEQKFSFLRKHFLYLKNEIRKQWKDTKILILYYHDEKTNEYIKTLEKDGFDVIYLSEITPKGFIQNPKNRVSEFDAHPTKEAWKVIVPSLYKEISNRYNIK